MPRKETFRGRRKELNNSKSAKNSTKGKKKAEKGQKVGRTEGKKTKEGERWDLPKEVLRKETFRAKGMDPLFNVGPPSGVQRNGKKGVQKVVPIFFFFF
jgi:hypothetical protein